MFTVNVVYATLSQQKMFEVKCNQGDSIKNVIEASGILHEYPEIDLSINQVGIFNQIKKLQSAVDDGDRIEIYRPLIANPKEVRRKRAQKQKEQGVI